MYVRLEGRTRCAAPCISGAVAQVCLGLPGRLTVHTLMSVPGPGTVPRNLAVSGCRTQQ